MFDLKFCFKALGKKKSFYLNFFIAGQCKAVIHHTHIHTH